MAKKSETPKSPTPAAAGLVPDYLLDPVPVPDVVESDSDTAWGLWQDSVQSLDVADTRALGDSVFDRTIPSDLTPTLPVKRKPSHSTSFCDTFGLLSSSMWLSRYITHCDDFGKDQCALGIVVFAQCAVQRNQPIADQSLRQCTAFARHGGGDGETGNAFG